jgi:hypothetical protein
LKEKHGGAASIGHSVIGRKDIGDNDFIMFAEWNDCVGGASFMLTLWIILAAWAPQVGQGPRISSHSRVDSR